MSIEVDATYRAGVIVPSQPLALPDNTPVYFFEELRQQIAKHSVSVSSLPPDFSREDIYRDHD